jgi:hypothetical protein
MRTRNVYLAEVSHSAAPLPPIGDAVPDALRPQLAAFETVVKHRPRSDRAFNEQELLWFRQPIRA